MAQNPETRIQNKALLAVEQRPDVLAMRLQSGVFRAYDDPSKIEWLPRKGPWVTREEAINTIIEPGTTPQEKP